VRTLYRRSRHSSHYNTDGSTTLGNASSIRELKSSDVEAADAHTPAPSTRAATSSQEARKNDWPPVSILLESERPFQRFEQYDGRGRG
jgi:hypothetical protein